MKLKTFFNYSLLAILSAITFASCEEESTEPEDNTAPVEFPYEEGSIITVSINGEIFAIDSTDYLDYEDTGDAILFGITNAGELIQDDVYKYWGISLGFNPSTDTLIGEYDIIDPSPYFQTSGGVPPRGASWSSVGEIEKLNGTTTTQIIFDAPDGKLEILEADDEKFSGTFYFSISENISGENIDLEVRGTFRDFPRGITDTND